MTGRSARRAPERTVLWAATACLIALTVVTSVAQRRVFADWAYLRPMLVVGVGVHLVAFTLRLLAVRLWIAAPLLALTAGELVALSHYADTLNGPLPGAATWDLFMVDVRLVLDQFATAVAPVPSEGSFAVVATIGTALAVILADTFAFRAAGRVEAIIPSGVLFVFTAALGTGGGRVGLAAVWLAAAVLTVAILRFHHLDTTAWMGSRRLRLATALPAIAVVVGLTSAAAAAVAPRLPGAGEDALVDTRNRRSSVTQVLSPLVDIRATLVSRGNLELFTVTSSGGGHYWRLIGLPTFDGSAWNPPEEPLVRMGDRSDDIAIPVTPTEQVFTITAMGGSLVPAAFYPTRVSPDDVYWAARSNSLVLPDNNSLAPGDVIAVRSQLPRPSVARLQAAGVAGADPADLALPAGVPDVAYTTAAAVTAGASSPFDKALALQQFFRTAFTYDTDVQYGNSNDAIEAFLRDRRGFCQQFAGTFAVMARALGIPARVAVGFTPGERGPDGVYRVYGRHAHAWPEIWLDGIGWIPMEPTPGRGNADTAAYTGVAAEQEGAPANPGTDPGTDQVQPTAVPPTTLPTDPDANPDGSATPGGTPDADDAGAAPPSSTSYATWFVAALAVAAALALWAAAAPIVVRRWASRRARTPDERVVAAWHRACRVLELAGAAAPPGATPLETAVVVEREIPVDYRTVRELANHLTTVVYAERQADEARATASERLSRDVHEMCVEVMPWQARMRMHLDPRLMYRLATG